MKVLSTEGLTKLIDLIKSSFISNEDTEQTTEIDTEQTTEIDTVETTVVDAVETSEVTLATVATTGAYSDLSGTPTVDQTYDGTSANAQSGVAVASAISGKADDNAVVHLAGNETITGEKTTTAKIEMRSSDGSTSPVILFHIPNVRYSRLIETSDGLTVQEGGGSSLDRLYAGASDANNTVITTVNKSKSSNGYLQLGNGIIIQWGFYENTGSQANKTLNLNKAFSNTNYKISLTQNYNSSSTYEANAYIRAKTMTSVDFRCPSGGVEWIAIGY